MKIPKYFLRSLLISLSFFSYIFLNGQTKKPLVGKEPTWITINTIDYANDQLDHEAENGYLDIAYEKQVSLENESIYYRKIIKIISEAGVQNNSEISVDFDPLYEQLVFHSIKIIRDHKSIDKLQLSKIKTIQQETDLNRHLYNGTLSSVLLMEDVRKGDIIEYSYTLKGFNPIFKGKYSDVFETVFSAPVCNLFYKIIVPTNRSLIIKNDQTDIKAKINQSDKETEYEWKLSNVHAFHLDDGVPSWYDPYGSIMLSEYKSWKEVNDWAMQLFSFDNHSLSPSIRKKIEEIIKKYSSIEDRILATLRFVQDDIRYLGIEMGENSQKPHSPDKIFTQRFGDCKDKSYLLCTLLRAMNIEADPVLINTSYKKTIKTWLPSAVAFDHTTVRVKFNDNYLFFDPTIPYQRGSIYDISYPDYQCGLVVDNNTTNLIDIPIHETGMVKVKEFFNIPDMSGTAQLKVITNYTGSFADDIRSSFNSNSKYEMLKTFQQYYADYFDKITGDSLSFSDIDSTGIFTTTEYYTILDLWKLEKEVKKATFQSFVIDGIIKKPKEADRKTPFSINYPAKYKEEIELDLPEEWNTENTSRDVSCTVFSFKKDFSYSYKKMLINYEYESHKDCVLPNELADFMSSYKKESETFAYILTWNEGGQAGINTSKSNSPYGNYDSFFGLLTLLGIGFAIWRIRKKWMRY